LRVGPSGTDIHAVTMRLVFIACLCCAACSRDQGTKSPPQRRIAAPVARSGPMDDSVTNPTIPDSVLKRVAALEDSLAHDSTGPRAPDLLWRLGTLTRAQLSEIPGTGHYGEYARAHRAQYGYYDSDAAFVYNGLHFTKLIERFPHDTLAPHAAYALTDLDANRECEGNVTCYIGRELFPLREFLNGYPNSPMARDAVLRINFAFDSTLAFKPGPNDLWLVDSAGVRAEIAGYDSTAKALPPALRALAMQTIDRLRATWKVAP
jgi:hypothetical protein